MSVVLTQPALHVSSISRKLFCALLGCALAVPVAAKDVRISLPKKSKPTPVQKLNQDGVKELEKHNYKKAKQLFYKAYLIDPDDPYTLNNLGYVAELDGQADRAQRYYALAASHASDALVYKSTEKEAVGKPVEQVAGNAADTQMQINRANVYAMSLLQKDRAPEADLALQKALKLDPNNPFTLNNLGYAREKEGELEDAYKYYTQAAAQHSNTPIVVTARPGWRGKGISDVAARNAESVQKEMARQNDIPERVARLNTRGVSAINRNDFQLAKQYFQEAYKLDPKNAFALNNMGYLAEADGDRETADFYYAKAKEAQQSGERVAYATRKDVEGEKLAAVAGSSDESVNKAIEEAAAARRMQGGPVVLHNRDNSVVTEPLVPPKPETTQPIHSVEIPAPGSGGLLQPLPESEQPKVPADSGTGAPSGQPAAAPPQPQGPVDNGIIMPLPDTQQPGAQPQTQAPNGQPPADQPQAEPHTQPQQPQQGPVENGIIMPLPDSQQPPEVKQPPEPH
ncbi:MAG: tetratricopeptide repeat protein [Acetobacteraceae bacterium]|nr:tetratricopeptide repeat protein [Acetobacteraceae bacterium]